MLILIFPDVLAMIEKLSIWKKITVIWQFAMKEILFIPMPFNEVIFATPSINNNIINLFIRILLFLLMSALKNRKYLGIVFSYIVSICM